VDLSGATIATSFPQIDLAGVDFSQAIFRAANLTEASLSRIIQINGQEYTLEAIFDDIIYDEFTDWPRGFILPPSATQTGLP
jgi:uncharacterized protein YjbI with pentapeptide repeats